MTDILIKEELSMFADSGEALLLSDTHSNYVLIIQSNICQPTNNGIINYNSALLVWKGNWNCEHCHSGEGDMVKNLGIRDSS